MLGLGLGLHRTINYGSRPFTPADIDTALWLDASRADTIIENVGVPGNVAQWDDLSGNLRHFKQSTEAQQPRTNSRTMNGINVLDFDGIDDALREQNYQNIPLNSHIFIVSKNDVVGITNHRVFSKGDSAIEPVVEGCFFRLSNTIVDTDNLSIVNSFGDLYDENTISVVKTTQLLDAPYGATISSFAEIGEFWDGAVAEIIITGDISTEIRQKIEGYLKPKWNIPTP